MTNLNPLVKETMPAPVSENVIGDDFITQNSDNVNNSLSTFQDIGADASINKQSEELGNSIAKAVEANNKDSGQTTEEGSNMTISDERMKELFGEAGTSLVDCIAKLNAYKFKYKPEAQEEYNVDNDEHVGVMAQELERNPATPNVVEELPDGTKTVDTKELTTANTAIISELAQRVLLLEAEVRKLTSK